MMRVVLLCVLASMVVSQCPNGSTPPTTTSYPNNNSCGTSGGVGGSGDNKTCKKVNVIDRPVSVIFKDQPVYTFIIANTPRFTRADNICFTFFPLPNDPEQFRAYQSFVYTDGSTYIESYITKSYETGANRWASPLRGFVNYNLGYIGCGAYARYSCPNYGYGTAADPFILVFGPGIGPVGNGTGKLTEECLENIRTLVKENGLELGEYYLLPNNLPSNCVFQQVCLPEGNPLSCRQGDSCEAYNTSGNA